jgi:hypothetical protein
VFQIIYHNLQWKKEYLLPSVFVVLFIKYFLVCYSITNSFRWDPSNIKIGYYKTTKREVLLFLLQNQTYMLHCLAIRQTHSDTITSSHTHFHMNTWLWNWTQGKKKLYLISENLYSNAIGLLKMMMNTEHFKNYQKQIQEKIRKYILPAFPSKNWLSVIQKIAYLQEKFGKQTDQKSDAPLPQQLSA